jgi:glucose-1-phosphate cytidylyltransferase
MKTVILCGGFGTRIRDVAENIPKPMIPIGGYPILWHIMKYYAASGFNQFILCLGYRGDVIRDFFINYRLHTADCTVDLSGRKPLEYHAGSPDPWQVTLAETGLNSMTGARLARIRKYVEADGQFMLTYGDGVGDVNLRELTRFHASHGKILTVTGVRPPGRFGEIACGPDGIVREFNEKPQAAGGWISGGFFVCSREIFSYLEPRENLVFEQEPMRTLVADGEMMMYRHDGFWMPMDTSREYLLLNSLYSQGKAPWVTW